MCLAHRPLLQKARAPPPETTQSQIAAATHLTMLLTIRSSLEAFALVALLGTAASSPRKHLRGPKDGLIEQLRRRQIAPSTTQDISITASMSVPSTGPASTYTIVTPSPSASPVPVTSMSQVVTTYVPVLTLCPASRSGAGGAATGAQSIQARSIGPYGNYTAAPYQNATSAPAARSECVTEWSASRTTICETMLQGIATKIHVTECDQHVTFSSVFGYSLSTIDPSDTTETGPVPTIQTVTTYFEAPWQSLTDGLTPSDVTQRVCSPVPTNSEECVDIHEVWSTIPTTITTTSSRTVCFASYFVDAWTDPAGRLT